MIDISKKRLVTFSQISSALYSVTNIEGKNLFEALPNKKLKGKNSVISFISNSDFVFDTLEISKNIPDSEIKEALFNIIYEELDNSLEYHIMFDEVKFEDKESREYRQFNIFVVSPNIIRYLISAIGKNVKYIDKLYPLPILFKSLYKFSGVSGRKEIFIYTYRDGTSINIFDNGELIYSKGLQFSTIFFFERFKEALEKSISFQDFRDIVTKPEKFRENILFKKALTVSLHSFFDEVDDVVNYVKRSYNIETIDNIYFSSEIGKILGLSEYSKALIGEHSFDGFLQEFSIGFDEDLDEIHYLLYITNTLLLDENIYLDILQAPPSFIKRPSGKFILTSASAVLLSTIYPIVNYYQEFLTRGDIVRSLEKRTEVEDDYHQRKKLIEGLLNEKSITQKSLVEFEKRYEKKVELLKVVFDKRDNYNMKGKFLASLTSSLNNHEVYISNIRYIPDGYFQLELISNSDGKITQLLKNLIQTHKISADLIELDRNRGVYISKLKIEI
jgi:hypothetical protein